LFPGNNVKVFIYNVCNNKWFSAVIGIHGDFLTVNIYRLPILNLKSIKVLKYFYLEMLAKRDPLSIKYGMLYTCKTTNASVASS